MPSLAITSKGQVTFKRDVLMHLGLQPGQRLHFEKLPAGELRLKAAKPTGSIERFIGCLAGKTDKVATIEEINEAAAAGWAGEVD